MQSSISSSQYSLCAASVTAFFSIGSLLSAQKMIDYPHQNLTEIAKNDKISSLISNSFPVTCLPLFFFFSKTPLNCFSSSLPFHAASPPPPPPILIHLVLPPLMEHCSCLCHQISGRQIQGTSLQLHFIWPLNIGLVDSFLLQHPLLVTLMTSQSPSFCFPFAVSSVSAPLLLVRSSWGVSHFSLFYHTLS